MFPTPCVDWHLSMNNVVVFNKFLCKQSYNYFESELILVQNEYFERFIDSQFPSGDSRQFQVVILNDIRFDNFYRSILQLIWSIEFNRRSTSSISFDLETEHKFHKGLFYPDISVMKQLTQ